MGVPKDCPGCGLVNPPDARRCDCGFDFAAGRVVGPPLPAAGRGAYGPGSAVLLAMWLGVVGLAPGAVAGAWVLARAAGPGPGGCGLGGIPLMLVGAVCGAVAGVAAGVATAALITRRWWRTA